MISISPTWDIIMKLPKDTGHAPVNLSRLCEMAKEEEDIAYDEDSQLQDPPITPFLLVNYWKPHLEATCRQMKWVA